MIRRLAYELVATTLAAAGIIFVLLCVGMCVGVVKVGYCMVAGCLS